MEREDPNDGVAQRHTLERLRERAAALGLGAGVTTELDELIARQRSVLRDTQEVAREIAAIRASRTWRLLEQLRAWRIRLQRARLGVRRLAGRRWAGRRGVVPATVRQSRPAVNVSGYITAESGMGEAVRSSIRALEHAGIPVALDNIESAQRTHDTSYTAFSREHPHPFNLVHLNADNMEAFATARGRGYFRDRYTIGFWFWELAKFRGDWLHAFHFVDEVWVASRFTKACLDEVSPVPVVHVPLALPALAPPPLGRPSFGIPDRGFVFLFVFDVSSQAERKNPLALIRAFRQAGFAHDEAVLVLKFTNPAFDRAAVRRLHQEAMGLHVLFLDGFMSRDELTALLNTTDAYVSLHRAEGFGLTLIEAMALGKPVIATGYSGNMDFMTAANSYPVEYRLTTLRQNSGPYPRGFDWADPDVDHAARLMRAMVAEPDQAREVGRQAAADVRAQFSLAVVAGVIERRLQAIASSAHVSSRA